MEKERTPESVGELERLMEMEAVNAMFKALIYLHKLTEHLKKKGGQNEEPPSHTY